ncbi:MAG: ABC transporter ATP-binding protein, partial [Oscillospiraceae bacterium]
LSMRLSYPRFALLQKAMDRVNAVVQEYLIGVRLVKAFGSYEEEAERFSAANANLMQRSVSTQRVITLIAPLMSLTVGLGTALVIFLGSKLFMLGEVQPGNISAFTIYMAQMLSSLLMMTNIFNTLVRTKASTARIQEVLDTKEDFSRQGGAPTLRGDLSFRNVTFSYPNGSKIAALNQLSFDVHPGESLAVIGPTGSGKSTLCWLLLRFYDVTGGEITVDGTNIKELDVDVLRGSIAFVPQSPMLFSGSVAENIRWGDAAASEERVTAAAHQAEADFIEEMEGGYDALLGSAGVNLSGGQKQRISIARGMLKNAPILILDDATSALDSVTEARLRETLRRVAKSRTLIAVTQRCTTAMFCDKILVIENGERVGFGTHDELAADCEVYRELYRSQVDGSMGGDADGR